MRYKLTVSQRSEFFFQVKRHQEYDDSNSVDLQLPIDKIF